MMVAVQSTDTLPTDFEEAIVGLPVGEWALDRTALSQLVEVSGVVGRLTLPSSAAAPARSCSPRSHVNRVWSGPPSSRSNRIQRRLRRFRATLRARGLDQFVDVVHAPLTPVVVGGMKFLCYSPGVIAEALDRRPPTLVIIDGPSQVSGGSRYPTLSQRHIAAPATFLPRRRMARRRADHRGVLVASPGITVDGIVPTEHGMLIGTVSAV